MTYTYDLAGNVTGLANNLDIPTPVPPNTVIAPGPNFQSFTYDDLYQLTGATGSYQGCACGCGNSRGYTLTMQYDQLGNIQNKNQTDTIFQPNGTPTTQLATSYTNGYVYNTTTPRHLPHAPSAIGNETTITYDADGNMKTTQGTFGPARTFAWTEDDRLSSEVDSGFTNSYVYDAAGNRTTKRRTSIETWYVNPFYVVKGYTSETKQIMLGDDRIASEIATLPSYTTPTTAGSGTVFYYHPDHLQSTNFTTGSDGSLLQHDEYFATGETWISESKNNDARNAQPWLFNAKELDETGLYAYGARYYNPKYSLWASPDPILDRYLSGSPAGGVFNPTNLALYTYAGNNPVVLRDPNGLNEIPATVRGKPSEVPNDFVGPLLPFQHRAEPPPKPRPPLPDAIIDQTSDGIAHVNVTRQTFQQREDQVKAAENLDELANIKMIGDIPSLGGGLTRRPSENEGDGLHGNDLDTTKPAVGYSLRDRDTGDILKYGETTQGSARYSRKFYDSNNADFVPEASGTKREMHRWQTSQIRSFKAEYGERPPLNKTDY